jgi:hypothetical protein
MKSIKLTRTRPTVAELLKSAKRGSVMLETSTGEKFLLTPADDFATEVELLRKNHAVLTFLDSRAKERVMVPLRDARK